MIKLIGVSSDFAPENVLLWRNGGGIVERLEMDSYTVRNPVGPFPWPDLSMFGFSCAGASAMYNGVFWMNGEAVLRDHWMENRNSCCWRVDESEGVEYIEI